jgi:hypothetical protein
VNCCRVTRVLHRPCQLSLELPAQTLDEIRKLAIVRRKPRQLLAVGNGGGNVPGVAVERDERQQEIAVPRVLGHCRLERRDGIVAPAAQVRVGMGDARRG